MSRPPGKANPDARGLAMATAAVAQMVVPILLGVWLDDRYGWSPWGAIGGTVIGFASLVLMGRNENRNGGKPPSDK